jgi:L-iditol 2-dehydrogenase
MEMFDVPQPAIESPHDVLIRLSRVGICGSDVHYFVEGAIGTQVVEFPFAVGHEGSGIVEQVGSAVTRLAPGDRIAFDPAVACGVCDQCLAGRPHTCRAGKFLGCPGQLEGCLADYTVLPEECCFRIPDDMSMDEAALVEPLSIGIYAVSLSIPMAGAKVGILGCGPIGLSVLVPAKVQGAERIYMTDKIDDRLAVARHVGADWTGNPDTEDVVAEIARQEPALLDVVFECTGDPAAIDQALYLLRPGGKLMLIGIPGAANRVSFDINMLRRKEICVQNVRRQNGCVQAAIDLIASRKIDFSSIITHHFPFTQTQEGFEMVAGYRDGVVKAMIVFS